MDGWMDGWMDAQRRLGGPCLLHRQGRRVSEVTSQRKASVKKMAYSSETSMNCWTTWRYTPEDSTIYRQIIILHFDDLWSHQLIFYLKTTELSPGPIALVMYPICWSHRACSDLDRNNCTDGIRPLTFRELADALTVSATEPLFLKKISLIVHTDFSVLNRGISAFVYTSVGSQKNYSRLQF
jgi:hypothetical protein